MVGSAAGNFTALLLGYSFEKDVAGFFAKRFRMFLGGGGKRRRSNLGGVFFLGIMFFSNRVLVIFLGVLRIFRSIFLGVALLTHCRWSGEQSQFTDEPQLFFGCALVQTKGTRVQPFFRWETEEIGGVDADVIVVEELKEGNCVGEGW